MLLPLPSSIRLYMYIVYCCLVYIYNKKLNPEAIPSAVWIGLLLYILEVIWRSVCVVGPPLLVIGVANRFSLSFSACFPPRAPPFRTSGIGQTRRIAQKTGVAFPAFLLVGGISALFLLVDMISQLFNCWLVYIVQKTQVAFPPFPLVGGISALFCYWLT